MTLLYCECLTDFRNRQVVCDHPSLVEHLPFDLRKVRQFGGPHRQWDHESMGKITNDAKQKPPLRRSIRHEASLTITQITERQAL